MEKLICRNFEEFRKQEGQDLPIGPWITVTQDMINAFAEATLDFQWIHVDVEKAKHYSPFKAPVAHGFLSVSLISKMLADVVEVQSVQMGVNYGLNKVRFPHPVVVDSRLRFMGKVVQIEDYGSNGLKVTWGCTIEIEGAQKPACVAEFVSLMFE
ncbi:MaoC family dehydratase [Flavobacteriaceae bacterium TP-CH-4]|uniref:MaoC family dehydratase n=1 Tax=Pelagihabitans pacificus TaxID=2696054 RepID=A0A967AWX3_9FLAO|nr:MaoC family dehydratase [Pelagihabitans pacificus]NHF58091.1 MaoC family dehydratase [Pelagihabitans pacificus]